jgi:imidazolonepropionase-like amidohydrolase
MTIRPLLICLSLLIVQLGHAQEKPNSLLLTNVRILDVNRGTFTGPTRIRISGNRIEAIGAELASQPGEAIELNLDGKFVLPGLIDLHSHLLLHPYNEASWNDQVLKEPLELRVIRGTLNARKDLESGFTTLRDLGTEGAEFADVAIRDAINQGMIPGPRVFAVTRALVTTGGYGPAGFDPRFQLPKGAQTADGVAGVRRATREQIAAGADWIKVYADYRRTAEGLATPTFSLEELVAIVDEAKSAGLEVSAHATTDAGIRRAVEAGVATIEHGYEASLETLKLMREKNVVLCPTLAASEAMAIYGGWKPGEPDPERITLTKQLMKNAIDSGVTIACGSDVGVFAHGDCARELELMFAYGMTAPDVLRAATSGAAKVLHKENELGLVAPGFMADLVVVESNPLDDLSALRKPIVVIKDGNISLNHLQP